MTQYKKWDIWEADVPFEEGGGSKLRPVVILSEEECLVISLKMTSHEPRYKKLEGEYEIMNWEKAGLKKPTVIQCSKVLRLEKGRIMDRKYGCLTITDIVGVQAMLKYMGI